MSGRRVTASAGEPTSNNTTGSASWTDNPDEVRQKLDTVRGSARENKWSGYVELQR